jgi:hypothetical protein
MIKTIVKFLHNRGWTDGNIRSLEGVVTAGAAVGVGVAAVVTTAAGAVALAAGAAVDGIKEKVKTSLQDIKTESQQMLTDPAYIKGAAAGVFGIPPELADMLLNILTEKLV